MKKILLLSSLFLAFSLFSFSQTQKTLDVEAHPEWLEQIKRVNVSQPQKIQSKQVNKKATQTFGQKLMPQHLPGRGTIQNRTSDPRNLPLDANGKLVSPEGLTVDFALPRNPDVTSICATPMPEITSASTRANCPIVVPCDNAANRDANIPMASDPITYFKLRWTVIGDGTANSNIDQARVFQLMAELNADFLPARIQFCASPANFVNNLTYYSLNASTEDGPMKTTFGDSSVQMINIYVVGNISNPAGAGGYARFPYDPLGGTNSRGGVVMARSNANTGTHTLAHELGHVFGLHHTFRGVSEVTPCTNCYEGRDLASGGSTGGDTEGDWCSDTNPHPINAFICGDSGTDGCAPNLPWLNSPVNNHMSYSFCTSQFTPQQMGRMHCMIGTYLNTWTNFGGGTCGNDPPIADFQCNPRIYQAPGTVTFTDDSSPIGLISTWTWNFDVGGAGGVTPATFVGQNPPAVTYANPGLYDVSLIVTNGNGSDTELKLNHIEMLAPASDCDTLDTQWLTPAPTPVFITNGAPGDFATGVPNSFGDFAYFERYFTPNPGSSTVGAIRVGLGKYFDADSSTRINALVYNDDGTGAPFLAQGAIGGLTNINPGALGAPSGVAFNEFYIPFFTPALVDSGQFHVGIEIFGNGPADSLIVVSSSFGQGQLGGKNHLISAPALIFNYLTNLGADIDLDIIPIMGEWATTPFVVSYLELAGCDTTIALFVDTLLYNSTMTSVTVDFFNGNVFTTTDPNEVDSIFFLWTSAPPDSVRFSTINDCGRTNSTTYFINYTFNESPVPDFTKAQTNPICSGAPGVDFNSVPTGMADYTWDFGDGTILSSGTSPTTNHVYTAPGLYYVTLTVTDGNGCEGEIQKTDFVEIVDCSVSAPLASFAVNPISGCQFETYTFTDQSAGAPDPATSWLWDFADGTFSILQNPPPHTFATAGLYNVTLTASNTGGSDVFAFPVTVNSCPLAMGLNLNAVPMGNDVGLVWESPSSPGELQFQIERKYENGTFTAIGETRGAGDSRFVHTDTNPNRFGGDIYYRIMMTDAAGSISFSNEAKVNLSNGASSGIRVYPNPVNPSESLTIVNHQEKAGQVVYTLFDMMGRTVCVVHENQPAGLSNFEMKIPDHAAGVYLLEVKESVGTKEVMKIVVE